MRRSTGFSANFSLLKAGSASALVLAITLSCHDSTAPATEGNLGPAALKYIEVLVPDSLKYPAGEIPNGVGNVMVGPSKALTTPVSASASSAVAPAAYLKSKPAFAPEAAPANRIALPAAPAGNDGYIPDVPLGFNFSFYGNSYDKLNVFANGLVTFGSADDAAIRARLGYYSADRIPDAADPNNMIALAWSDWSPSRAGVDAIRYETRGSAPHRRFILQYTNVPEFGSFAVMTVQLVLDEGSNDITIYSPTMSTTRSVDLITQGIENADGTDAAFDSTLHPILLEWYPRVRGFYKLTNDAVRFSPLHVNQPPVIVAPPSISVTTAPPVIVGGARLSFALTPGVGTCSAIVDPGTPTATDDADGVTVAGVRKDGAQLSDPYPKGVTTIVWTATDADGLASSAEQIITVSDKEKPLVMAPADISARIDRGQVTATVAAGTAAAEDNCAEVKVSSARSDGAALTDPYPIGLTAITWTATDESGNSSSANQSIDVHGNMAPAIAISGPANFVVNMDQGVCNALVNIGMPSVTDDDAGVSLVPVRSDGRALSDAYPKGTTMITWTATDAEKLSASASQSVTVSDNQKPSIMAPANISRNNDPGLPSAVVASGSAASQDNCGEVIVSSARSDGAASGAPYKVGLTTINWMALDAAGNSASATQSITVMDNEAPSLSVPANFSVPAMSPSGAAVNYTLIVNDNVKVASVTCTRMSGSTFPIGPNPVTCTAVDAAGNSTSRSFVVTVGGVEEQLVDLISWIQHQGFSNGVANPLVNQLRAASGDSANACKKMSDFMSMLSKKGSGILDGKSAYMSDAASGIMIMMGCSTAAPSAPAHSVSSIQ